MYILHRQLNNMQRQMLVKRVFDTHLPDCTLVIVVKKIQARGTFPVMTQPYTVLSYGLHFTEKAKQNQRVLTTYKT